MQEEYGLYVWPCSIVLAEYIWQNRQRFAGARVLEVPQLFCVCALKSLPIAALVIV